MKLLAFDPSGNFYEGKGTTGWAFYYDDKPKSVGQIRAEEFDDHMSYWKEHLELIKVFNPDVVVIESYALYAHTSSSQIGSEFETSQLIGIIKYACYENDIQVITQPASIKRRFSNKILLYKGIITQDNNKRYYILGIPVTQHILDAIRHAEFYIHFTRKKVSK